MFRAGRNEESFPLFARAPGGRHLGDPDRSRATGARPARFALGTRECKSHLSNHHSSALGNLPADTTRLHVGDREPAAAGSTEAQASRSQSARAAASTPEASGTRDSRNTRHSKSTNRTQAGTGPIAAGRKATPCCQTHEETPAGEASSTPTEAQDDTEARTATTDTQSCTQTAGAREAIQATGTESAPPGHSQTGGASRSGIEANITATRASA